MPTDPTTLHADSIVIDAVCPLLTLPHTLEDYRRGGLTVVAPTVGGVAGAAETLKELGAWSKLLREREDLLLVRTASDVYRAKVEKRLGIILHFQGVEPLEKCLDYIDAYKSMGVGIIQIAYNERNRIGDGCEEPSDAGLSRFGRDVIRRLNAARVIIDCSHTGHRTTMEAIELSDSPVVFSHSNAYAVFPTMRNIKDDQIKAVAATGGLVGIVGSSFHVSADIPPTLSQVLDHVDYIAQLVGPAHVGFGIDYFSAQDGYMPLERQQKAYEYLTSSGMWDPATYYPPPWPYPVGMETPDKFANITAGLLERGYSEPEVKGILGENWVRVYQAVWG